MGENAYEEWNAEVARIVTIRHPLATVTHEKELGGGCNAVVVEGGSDTVVVVTNDALGIYTHEQWFGDGGTEYGEFPFTDVMGTPQDAADRAEPYIIAAGC